MREIVFYLVVAIMLALGVIATIVAIYGIASAI